MRYIFLNRGEFAARPSVIMFAGLIEELGTVVEVEDRNPGQRLVVEAGEAARDTAVGDSIAINGCCLTVVSRDAFQLAFDVGPETLKCTNLGEFQLGTQVNVECSLRIGDRLGGHFVTGHVDAVGRLDRRIDEQVWSTFWFRIPPGLSRQMASKGSIAVDGISLTLVDVEPDRFSVALIPHTLRVTTLGQLAHGAAVNLETDLLAKYVQQQLATHVTS